MLTRTGSYKGTSAALSITGVGFQPDLVVVKNLNTVDDTYFRTKDMGAGLSLPIRADAGTSSTAVLSLDSDGFSVGTATAVTGSGNTIAWLAIKDDGANDFTTLAFTGDGTDDKLIFSGFQPDFALIKSTATIVSAQKFAGEISATGNQASNRAIPNYQGTGSRADLMYFGVDGLRVSNGSASGGNLVNMAALQYGFAMKATTGLMVVGSYTGTGSSGLTITTGFNPTFIDIHREDAGQVVIGWRPQFAGGYSAPWDGLQVTGKILSTSPTGFTVSADTNVNASGITYWYMALAAPSVGDAAFLRMF